MFEKIAHELGNAAISEVAGRIAEEFSNELITQGYNIRKADSLAQHIILESMLAASVNIADYYSVKSWAEAFRHQTLQATAKWGFKGMDGECQEKLRCWIKQVDDPKYPSDQIMVRLPATQVVSCLPPDVPSDLAAPLIKLCYILHECIARMNGDHFTLINEFLSRLPERLQSPMISEIFDFRPSCYSSSFDDLMALGGKLFKTLNGTFRMVAQLEVPQPFMLGEGNTLVSWFTRREEGKPGKPLPDLDLSSIFGHKPKAVDEGSPSSPRNCPACGLSNSQGATVCDCGYSFVPAEPTYGNKGQEEQEGMRHEVIEAERYVLTSKLERFILRPMSLAYAGAALFFLFHRAWLTSSFLVFGWFLVGAIGGTLPFHKSESYRELALGSPNAPHGEHPLPDEVSPADGFQAAKIAIFTGLLLAITAVVLGMHYRIRWYYAMIVGVAAWVGSLLLLMLSMAFAFLYPRMKSGSKS